MTEFNAQTDKGEVHSNHSPAQNTWCCKCYAQSKNKKYIYTKITNSLIKKTCGWISVASSGVNKCSCFHSCVLSWRFGDVKHAQAFVFLQKLVLGPDLLSEGLQFVLLQRRTHVDPRHGWNLLPSLLNLRLQFVQLLMYVWTFLIHAIDRWMQTSR